MSIKFSQLQCKEVICLCDGRRLGYISDVQIELPDGHICAVIVPGPCRHFGLWGRKEDYRIPFSCIQRIGPDIVLVDAKPEDCKIARQKQQFF